MRETRGDMDLDMWGWGITSFKYVTVYYTSETHTGVYRHRCLQVDRLYGQFGAEIFHSQKFGLPQHPPLMQGEASHCSGEGRHS